MSFLKRAVAASVAITMLGSSALAASESIRPSMSLANPASPVVPLRAGTRLGGQ